MRAAESETNLKLIRTDLQSILCQLHLKGEHEKKDLSKVVQKKFLFRFFVLVRFAA